ncbi:hypothetical protein SDC9_140628 [bioreactor metagenome]|uniref:Uncharacterized protein n=1 Tax=bioreactor metagenome TaxID=1076179 RepID=A0A645DVF8_9ZZZZ
MIGVFQKQLRPEPRIDIGDSCAVPIGARRESQRHMRMKVHAQRRCRDMHQIAGVSDDRVVFLDVANADPLCADMGRHFFHQINALGFCVRQGNDNKSRMDKQFPVRVVKPVYLFSRHRVNTDIVNAFGDIRPDLPIQMSFNSADIGDHRSLFETFRVIL